MRQEPPRKAIEEEVRERLEQIEADSEKRERYGLDAGVTVEELRQVVTLEVQTERQRRRRTGDDEVLPAGQWIRQRYELRRKIGRGAQGRTYLAWDHHTEEEVAVKELLLRDVEDWKAIELFEREGQALEHLDHAGIPDYVDAFHIEDVDGERFFLVQEFVDGQDFETLVDEGLIVDERRAREILAELLEILVYLQSLSPPVIHRDIKPSNIMRHRDGSLALIDFGAVQSVIPNEEGGSTIIGSSGYMPMEQLMGRAGPATDVYAAGATVIHLLSRRHPADLPMSNLRLQFEEFINVSAKFSDYLDRLVAPDIDRRFSDARAALEALQALDRPSPAAFEPSPPPSRVVVDDSIVRPAPDSQGTNRRRPTSSPPTTVDASPSGTDSNDGVIGTAFGFLAELYHPLYLIIALCCLPVVLLFSCPACATYHDHRAERAVESGDLETAMDYRQRNCRMGFTRACAYLSAVAIEIDPGLAEDSARRACNRDIALGCANYADIYLRRYTDTGNRGDLRSAWRHAERGCDGESDTGCARLAIAELYQNDLDAAQRAALRGLGINDRQPYPHKALGLTLVIEGDVEAAIQSFADADRAAQNPVGREHPVLTQPIEEIAARRLQTLVPYYPERQDEIDETIGRLR